jgi:hypothetical protein
MRTNAPAWTSTVGQHALLDDPIRPQQQRLRDRDADGLRGLHVDHQLELRRLFDGEISGLGALEDPIDKRRRPAIVIGDVDSI